VEGFIVAVVYGAIVGAAVGGLSAKLSGGNVSQGIFGGMRAGAIAGAMFYGAGEFIGGFDVVDSLGYVYNSLSSTTQAAVHAVAGAASGALNAHYSGGDVGQAALVGGLSAGAANWLGGGIGARVGVGAAAGGMSSVMNGGDFAEGALQGAWTSAAGLVFNHMLHGDYNIDELKDEFRKTIGRIPSTFRQAWDSFWGEGMDAVFNKDVWENGYKPAIKASMIVAEHALIKYSLPIAWELYPSFVIATAYNPLTAVSAFDFTIGYLVPSPPMTNGELLGYAVSVYNDTAFSIFDK
jgi:hypothetical protein